MMTNLGIVKNYLKFTHDALFGGVACIDSNIVFLPDRDRNIGKLCMVGFAEKVIIWNLTTHDIVKSLPADKFELSDKVTYLSYYYSCLDELIISIGYESGYVVLYSLWSDETLFTSRFHKHAISYMMFTKPDGNDLICGSKDTTISVYNLINEKGYKLEGHKSPVTKLHYIPNKDLLISSSQDGFIKFWMFGAKRCFKTFTNPSEIWDFHYSDNDNLLVTGCSDTILRLFLLEFKELDRDIFSETSMTDKYSNLIQANPVPGDVVRQNSKRVVELKVDQTGRYMICNTRGKLLELYKLLNADELKKRLKKKSKKASKTNQDPMNVILQGGDRLKLIKILDLPHRCTSVDMILDEKMSRLEILASLTNNTVAMYQLDVKEDAKESRSTSASAESGLALKYCIRLLGHRTAIIHCQLTSDKTGVFTVSLSEAKLWDMASLRCVQTISWSMREVRDQEDIDELEEINAELGLPKKTNLEATTALLLPGDRHALIGYKNGVMSICDLMRSSVVQWVKKHEDRITSFVLGQDPTCIMSGSTDKTLKFWKLQYSQHGQVEITSSGNEEQYKNGISSIAVTPDGKLIIIGFLDNKVRTYLSTDTSKRVLDLYGHVQPVVCISVKYDSSQVLTGSGDKTVRSWNLPHGDCKIFKGHTEAVTDVRYIPGRSMAFSSDKSGLIIQIDLKDMVGIFRLNRHYSSISCLAVDAAGTEADDDELVNALLISVGTDRSIRLWNESDEIFTRESAEMDELDKEYEETIANDVIVRVGVPKDTGINVLTIKTLKTVRAADDLIEAINIYDQIRIDPKALPHPKMVAFKFEKGNEYVMFILGKINRPDLELVLAQLPLTHVDLLLPILADFTKRNVNLMLADRCFSFLCKLHLQYFIRNREIHPLFAIMSNYVTLHCNRQKGINGLNIAYFDHYEEQMRPEVKHFVEQRPVKKPKTNKNK